MSDAIAVRKSLLAAMILPDYLYGDSPQTWVYLTLAYIS